MADPPDASPVIYFGSGDPASGRGDGGVYCELGWTQGSSLETKITVPEDDSAPQDFILSPLATSGHVSGVIGQWYDRAAAFPLTGWEPSDSRGRVLLPAGTATLSVPCSSSSTNVVLQPDAGEVRLSAALWVLDTTQNNAPQFIASGVGSVYVETRGGSTPTVDVTYPEVVFDRDGAGTLRLALVILGSFWSYESFTTNESEIFTFDMDAATLTLGTGLRTKYDDSFDTQVPIPVETDMPWLAYGRTPTHNAAVPAVSAPRQQSLYRQSADAPQAPSGQAGRVVAAVRSPSDTATEPQDETTRAVTVVRNVGHLEVVPSGSSERSTATSRSPQQLVDITDQAQPVIAYRRTAQALLDIIADAAGSAGSIFNRASFASLDGMTQQTSRVLAFNRRADDVISAVVQQALRGTSASRSLSNAVPITSELYKLAASIFIRTAEHTLPAVSAQADRVLSLQRSVSDAVSAVLSEALRSIIANRSADSAVTITGELLALAGALFTRTASYALTDVTAQALRTAGTSRSADIATTISAELVKVGVSLTRTATLAVGEMLSEALRSTSTSRSGDFTVPDFAVQALRHLQFARSTDLALDGVASELRRALVLNRTSSGDVVVGASPLSSIALNRQTTAMFAPQVLDVLRVVAQRRQADSQALVDAWASRMLASARSSTQVSNSVLAEAITRYHYVRDPSTGVTISDSALRVIAFARQALGEQPLEALLNVQFHPIRPMLITHSSSDTVELRPSIEELV